MKKVYFAFLSLLFAAQCIGQLNMQLLKNIDYQQSVNDVWGWADTENNKEYAFVGTQTGLSIVDVTDPVNSFEKQFIKGPNSTWRDIKNWGPHIYVTNETGGGVLVVDMSFLQADTFTWHRWQPFIADFNKTLTDCHNLYIDEFGYCYLAGCNMNNGGILIADVFTNPGNPIYLSAGANVYSHDAFAQDNRLYTSEIYDGNMGIYDVSDKANINLLAKQQTPFSFTHNVWVNNENTVAFTTDEKGNAPVAAYDITDLDDIRELDQFRPISTIGTNVIPHNVHVWDNWLIISYYTSGGIVADASRPDNIIEVGNWDTYFGGNAGFSGAWGAYPFLPSGLVLISDRQSGLFVCGVDYVRACWLEGKITDASTGSPIFGADIHIESTQANAATSNLLGNYKTGQAVPGTFDVVVSASGYISKIVSVTLKNDSLSILDVALEPLVPIASYTGQVVNKVDGSPIAAAQVILESPTFRFTTLTDQDGNFSFTNIHREHFTIAAARWGYQHAHFDNFLIEQNTPPITLEMYLGYQDDFFVSQGWTNQNSASQGWWQREEPTGTMVNGQTVTPYKDVPDDIGRHCFITNNNGQDVDGGYARLVSPTMDLTLYYDPIISYQTWFVNAGNSPNDTLQVRLNNGTEEVVLENITTSNAAWNDRSQIRVADFIEITDNMKVIFDVWDAGADHLVEAGVDAFLVQESAFPPLAAVESACQGKTVQFSETSGYAYQWNWSFENGAPASSNDPMPSITYDVSGTHAVNLEVTTQTGAVFNLGGADFMEIKPLPSANFSLSNLDTLAATLANASANAYTYQWDFGDGNTSSEIAPTHSYPIPGSYTVTLIAEGECGISIFTDEITILPYQPTAHFATDTTAGCAPLVVQFSDASFGFPDSWEWSLPGGTPTTSSERNPMVTYNVLGEYEVTLKVTNAAGNSTVVRTGLIKVDDVPDVGFSFSNIGADVNFINSSTNAMDYVWTFNDSTVIGIDPLNPSFTFPGVGTYEVTLQATNGCGTSSITQEVYIDAVQPTADFSISQTTGCAPLAVEFFDQSLDAPTSWEWSFPGGIPAFSSEPNPVVLYENGGVYSVELKISNSAGASEVVKTDVIIVNDVPVPDFSFMVSGPDVTFTNTSENGLSYEWQILDGTGTVLAGENPTYTFPDLGNYEVILYATNECGTTALSSTVAITAVPPMANFTASEGIGCAPFSVTFNDQSYGGEISAWEWTFPGGTPAFSTEQNPTVVFSQQGTYSVTLKVTNPVGTSETTLDNIIVVRDAPTPQYSFLVNGPNVTFTNSSFNAEEYEWDFGDGSISSAVNPTHQFSDLGDFVVVLSATNDCGTTVYTDTITITAIQPTAGFSVNEKEGCIPFEVTFEDKSEGGEISAWEWTFQGGNPATSTEQNPIVVYEQTGTFDVKLKVTNPVGVSQTSLFDLIKVGDLPTANFNYTVNGPEVQFSNQSMDALDYAWEFGDGETSGDFNPMHVFPDTGIYEVILTVFNKCGANSFTQTIEITNPTAVEDLSGQLLKFMAYPNPFSAGLQIDYQLISFPKNAELTVTNILGETVFCQKLEDRFGQVFLNDELKNSGVYFVHLRIGHAEAITLKVVRIKG